MPPTTRPDLPDGRWLIVIAGPNGAGKSTFFDLYLRPRGFRFVNADLIAAGIAGGDPATVAYRAAELADIERRALIARGDTFVMETVLSDPHGAKLGLLREAKDAGYHVALLFIGIESPELSSARVAQRVALGGHDVPDEKIVARFPRTLANASQAIRLADAGWIFDNADADHPYRLLATTRDGRLTKGRRPLPAWCRKITRGLVAPRSSR
ncbi:MAG: zeta toxin family protein [Burkholderiales bacterium]